MKPPEWEVGKARRRGGSRHPGGQSKVRPEFRRKGSNPRMPRFDFKAREQGFQDAVRGVRVTEVAKVVSRAEGREVKPGDLLVWWLGEGRLLLPPPELGKVRTCVVCGLRRTHLRPDTWMFACRKCYRDLARDRWERYGTYPIPWVWPVPCVGCGVGSSTGETTVRWENGVPQPWDREFRCRTCLDLSQKEGIDSLRSEL